MAEDSDRVSDDKNWDGGKNNDDATSGKNWARGKIYDVSQHEEVPMIPLGGRNHRTQLREVFIQELHKKFQGDEPSDFLTHNKTELAGKEVEVKLTGKNGNILSKSTIENAKGGRDFFKALNSDSSWVPRIPLKPTVVLRQKVENIEMEVLSGKLDELQLQEEMETVIDNPDAPLTTDDRRELRGAVMNWRAQQARSNQPTSMWNGPRKDLTRPKGI
jgi:hypothetical protein